MINSGLESIGITDAVPGYVLMYIPCGVEVPVFKGRSLCIY